MARRSSRGSVYNKRSNEQVQTARTSGNTGGGILPQAYAQSSNPTQNQSPQARTQSTQFDPWARATQFVHNVGRGGYDVGRSYTTDIADTAHSIATGRDRNNVHTGTRHLQQCSAEVCLKAIWKARLQRQAEGFRNNLKGCG